MLQTLSATNLSCSCADIDILATLSGQRSQRQFDLKKASQKSTDRSDIVARVFHMKLEEYLADIKEGHIFCPVRAGT